MNTGRDILLGVAVGDALGVPVEFKKRTTLNTKPVTGMLGYGTHQQPKGTWSDDSSLSFCLAESLATKGYDLVDIARKVLDWFNNGLWTAHGEVFDIGGQTRNAIDEISVILKHKNYEDLKSRQNTNEYSNGNGGLMRILPLVLETFDLSMDAKYRKIKEVTSLTHGHIRSTLASLIYILIAEFLIEGLSKEEAYLATKKKIKEYYKVFSVPEYEQQKFIRIIDFNIATFTESEIKSDGYVVHSLEASLWSFLRTEDYKSAVLTAINLGEDTDTNGAITGGLAGIAYNASQIPLEWKTALVGRAKIEALGDQLYYRYYES